MILLLLFSFVAGIITILSPCILPILPIVLSGGIDGGKKRPLGVVTGFIISFTFFTLALSTIVKLTGLSADLLRSASVIIILLFGIMLLFPQFQTKLESLFSKLSSIAPKGNQQSGFGGGIVLGLSLGLIWTPCVGPIIAAVITLAATSTVSFGAVLITLAYSIGTALPMLLITYTGRALMQKNPWLLANTGKIQKIFGILMIITAIGIHFNYDRKFQAYILDTFPQYGTGLTSLEDNAAVREELQNLQSQNTTDSKTDSSAISAPEIIPGGEWFNSEPLTISSLKGKVVLVDFWTYTCINCIRTLPYIQEWNEKYSDKGLVIIGVHTPEFEFEKNPDNLQKAINDYGLTYPIVQDNNYATWRAYSNRYWPAKYFIDKDGNVRGTHFGEGAYDESEALIQKLLAETGSNVDNISIENEKYSVTSKTPETYLGYARIEHFVSPESIKKNTSASYSVPSNLVLNDLAYSGTWAIGSEYAAPSTNAELQLRFEAKNVYLVMRSEKPEGATIKVYLDNKLISDENAGEDVHDGSVTITTDRLYTLVSLDKAAQHTLRLVFEDGNAELFAFTFG